MASILIPLLIRDDAASANTTDSNSESQYGYEPSEAIAILFIVLFGISTALHVGQAVYFRTWWLLPTAVLCGVGELIGWGARLWSAISPEADTPFTMQISATIIAPTPLLAASFIIFSRVVQQLGVSYSVLSVRLYAWIFVSCDVVALVIQGLGGGLASAADTLEGANRGANIMLGGIGFQFMIIVIFSLLVTDFLIRYLRDAPWRSTPSSSSSESTSTLPIATRGTLTIRTKTILSALCFSTLVLFIRSVYRIIELGVGWNGRIIHTQVYFNVLDGGMVVLAIFTWNFVHPGVFLVSPTVSQRQVEETKGFAMASREPTAV
ncbi:RTA1 like protein-domain-containing protein [Mycena amicta]|nr:RTA1 like protein-domain-containing protein [Mycena amicta]